MVRIDRILCPVDFFPASERAVRYAIALAKYYEARLILLHVVTPIVPASYDVPIDSSGILESMTRTSKEQLDKLAKKAESEGVPVKCLVTIGDIDLEVRDVATRQKANLIVMGTHGRRGLEKWFLGSATERLLRRVPVPLLTISSPRGKQVAPPSFKRILVTTDFSEGSSEAIDYAFSIAQECEANTTLLHVINDVDADVSGRYRDPLIKSVRAQLEKLVPAGARDWCTVDTRVETGLPYRVILRILESEKVDLLVMNVHGKGMLDRALIGSNAERVVRGATSPVLLIPKPIQGRKKPASKKVARNKVTKRKSI